MNECMSSISNKFIVTFYQNTVYKPIENGMVDTSEMARTARISTLPTTYSSQQLMPPSDTESIEDDMNNDESGVNNNENNRNNNNNNVINTNIINNVNNNRSHSNSLLRRPNIRICNEWFTLFVLCFVNLINYMDRFTIAGILDDIQIDFKIADDDAGLLQTAFVVSYMICAPLFGYLGDRYSRRVIMATGVLLWSTTTLLGSFMSHYGWFIAFRAMVGIGEASYSIIAPTIISDLFVHNERTKMLGLFYIFIPVGSGLGYIIGSETANLAGNWRWALRVTPILGVIAVILIMFIKDPERGESEGSHHLPSTTYKEDIKYLIKNRSFMFSTVGFTCVAFVTGALAWWGPKFMYLGFKMQPGNENLTPNVVSFKFGAITMVAGILGVPLGSILSQVLVKYLPTADPLLCAIGLILSVPLMTGAMIVVSDNTIITYLLTFFGQLCLNINWPIVADMLLYVVVPTRRATAEAFQILISHALGDAISPYLVGTFSELIKKHLRSITHQPSEFAKLNGFESLSLTMDTALNRTIGTTSYPLNLSEDTDLSKFEALQYALFSTSFIEVIGGVFFLITAAFILQDKQRAHQATENGNQQPRILNIS